MAVVEARGPAAPFSVALPAKPSSCFTRTLCGLAVLGIRVAANLVIAAGTVGLFATELHVERVAGINAGVFTALGGATVLTAGIAVLYRGIGALEDRIIGDKGSGIVEL